MSVADYYDSLIEQVDNVSTCDALVEITAEIDDIFTDNLAAIQSSIDALAPLLTSPDPNFTAIIEWIDAVIVTYSGPNTKLVALQAATLAKQIETTAAILAKATELGCT